MAVPEAMLAAALARVRGGMPELEPDGWLPSVQGAVGHVVGLRDRGGARYVLKVFPAAAEGRLETEQHALPVVRRALGDRVPRLIMSGRLPAGDGYLVMSRLAGTRWADRRRALDDDAQRRVISDTAGVLRSLHSITGNGYGPLATEGTPRSDGWAALKARASKLIDDFGATGGSPALADRVQSVLALLRPHFQNDALSTLCHNDINDGNLLITGEANPRVSGVVDFERASWSDPMSDLARTCTHLRFHSDAQVATLLAHYGQLDDDALHRLRGYELLHMVEERAWIAVDQPPGWQASLDRLDRLITGWV